MMIEGVTMSLVVYPFSYLLALEKYLTTFTHPYLTYCY